jgi:hypothetical protein
MKLRNSVLSISLVLGIASTGVATADLGNRYGLPQVYHSEISAAEAMFYRLMTWVTKPEMIFRMPSLSTFGVCQSILPGIHPSLTAFLSPM